MVESQAMSRFSRQLSRVLHIPPRTLKVLRDLTANKSRTMLVVLSIAVGIFAIASTLGARQVLMREFDRGFYESQRFSISFTLNDRSQGTGGVVRLIEARDDVESVSARRIVSGSFTLIPDDMSELDALHNLPEPGAEREIIHIQAVDPEEFDQVEVSRFHALNTRAWPPGPDDIIIEASALQVYDINIGDRILVEAGHGRAVFRIAGFAHDINAVPTMFFDQIESFVSMDALRNLNMPEEYNRVLVNVDPNLTRVQAAAIADSIQEKQFNSANIQVARLEVPEPDFHFFGSMFEAVSVLLLVMAFMALALSAFLVITTTNAILIQQSRQLGIMKAIGARRTQITGLYVRLVLAYGLLALVVGLPVGIIFGYNFIEYAASVLNFYVEDMTFPVWVIILLFAVSLLLPFCAALVPIMRGVKRPIVDSLSSYANVIGFGGGWLDRLLSRITFLSRPTALALRSTFAKKGRLALTLTTLTLASAVVMSVFSAHASLQATVDDIGSWWRYDAQVTFAHPVSNDDLKRIAYANDSVIYAETWLDSRFSISRPDGTLNDSFWGLGIPEDTRILDFYFEEGGWPEPGSQAVIVNTELFATEEYLSPPTTVTIIVNGQEVERPVAGIVTGSLHGAMMFLERDDLAELMGIPNASTRIVVQAEGGQISHASRTAIFDRGPMQQALVDDLDERFLNQGYIVASTQTAARQLSSSSEHLDILTTFLLIMASALAIVGVIGLSGSMTLSVIESTREIGIMRSVGASHSAIFGIYITQGLVIGTIAWFLGAWLSWPMSYGLMYALRVALEMRLAYAFSPAGVVIWLVLVWIISIVASMLPAWRAAQVSIRDAISHE